MNINDDMPKDVSFFAEYYKEAEEQKNEDEDKDIPNSQGAERVQTPKGDPDVNLGQNDSAPD